MRPEKKYMDNMIIKTLERSISRYISSISESHGLSNDYKSTKGIHHYGFVPMDTMAIVETLIRLHYHMTESQHSKYKLYGKHKFLDIGCGIGNIVLLALIVGFDAHGLEYNKKIYEVAKGLIGKHRVFKGDMLDSKRYGEYDVLYYYVPIANCKVMDRFAGKLARAMKRGAYVVCGQPCIFEPLKEFERIKLSRNNYLPVYRKHL